MKPRPTATDAERALLGGLMVDPHRIGDVLPLVKSADFHAPTHRALFELLVAMRRAGESIDTVSVPMRVGEGGRQDRFGGVVYVRGLEDACPSTVNLTHYAKLVRDVAIRRRLMDAADRLLEQAATGEDAAWTLAQAQAELARVHEGEEQAHGIGAVLEDVLDGMQAVIDGTATPGLPTGYGGRDEAGLDARLGGGLRPGELTILAARPAMGKAQPLNEPVMTPSGPMPMGSIGPGDLVLGRDGKPRAVLAVWPQGRKPVYRVEFSDGTHTRCCAEHLWTVTTRNGRRREAGEEVVSLASMVGNLRVGGHWNYQVPVAAPVELTPSGALPMDPWLLGVLLGDGSLNKSCPGLTNSETDIQERVRASLPAGDELINAGKANEFRIRGQATRRILDSMDLRCLSAEKHVPEAYLMAPIADRVALLQGLCDTDGHVASPGVLEWGSVSPRLRDAFVWLVQSLGGRVTVNVKQPTYTYRGERRQGQPFYRCYAWFADVVPVSSRKHLAKWTGDRTMNLRVVDIIEAGEEECQCLTVEGGEYLTRDFLVTHNTAFAMCIAVNVARQKHAVGVFSMEMRRQQLVTRLVPMFSGVPLQRVVDPNRTTPGDWDRIAAGAGALKALPIWIDDTPHLKLEQLAQRARGMVARGAALIVIDYLTQMWTEGRNQVAEVGRNVTGLKHLARELDVPIICLAQLNRDLEKRANKRPIPADLRDSGEVEQAADCILFVYRDKVYNEEADASEMEIIIAKARMGQTCTVVLEWDGEQQQVSEGGPL